MPERRGADPGTISPNMHIFIKDVLLNEQRTNIEIERNIITGIGSNLPVPVNAIIIEGKNLAAFPALANCHTHAAMTLFRGYGDDHPLDEWLNKFIFPKEKELSPEKVYWGTRLACLEMIKSGTACMNDMYFFTPEVVRAVSDSGIRAAIGFSVADLFDTEKTKEFKQIYKSLEPLFEDSHGGRIHYSAAPHSIYTVSEEMLRWLSGFAKEHDMLYHMHMSETIKEVDDCLRKHRCRPYEYIERIGILSQTNSRFIGAHSLHVSEDEIAMMGHHRINVVHNPNSNLKLASGHQFRCQELKQAGVNVTLGTDGCSSSNNLDMIEAAKTMSLLQKGWRMDPTAMAATETLETATRNGYRALRFDGGRIEVGALADLMLADLDNIAFVPNNDTLSNLIYAAHGDCIDTLICDGEILMRHREVKDEKEIISQIRKLT